MSTSTRTGSEARGRFRSPIESKRTAAAWFPIATPRPRGTGLWAPAASCRSTATPRFRVMMVARAMMRHQEKGEATALLSRCCLGPPPHIPSTPGPNLRSDTRCRWRRPARSRRDRLSDAIECLLGDRNSVKRFFRTTETVTHQYVSGKTPTKILWPSRSGASSKGSLGRLSVTGEMHAGAASAESNVVEPTASFCA